MSVTAHGLTKNSGTMLYNEVTTLKGLVKSLPANPIIVNIGTGRGISVLAMLEARLDAVIFTVDIGPCELAFDLLKKSGQDVDRVIQVRGASAAVGEHFALDIDAAFIDGDHHYESVCEDIRVWYPKIKPGGIIIFHDHAPPNPRKETAAQLQKEAWVEEAARDMLLDGYFPGPAPEVIAHADRIKAFRKSE